MVSRRIAWFAGVAAGLWSWGSVPLEAHAQQSQPYSTESSGLPILNSYSAAEAKIYLDFHWERRMGGSENVLKQYGFNIDPATGRQSATAGDPTRFDAFEQAAVFEIWRQVAGHFAPFNINVTTVKPNDMKKTAWLAFTPTGKTGGNGGNFGDDDGKSDAAVATNFGLDAPVGVAHEVGHIFGLNHTVQYDGAGVLMHAKDPNGNPIQSYARDPLDPLHHQIMGITKTTIESWKWTFSHSDLEVGSQKDNDPSYAQDDVKIIADAIKQKTGGDGFRPDEPNSTPEKAKALVSLPPLAILHQTGVIERTGDEDVFSFTVPAGSYAIRVGRDTPSHVALNVRLTRMDGSPIAQHIRQPQVQPPSRTENAHFSVPLPAGTYLLWVSSQGNYDDLGQYQILLAPLEPGWTARDVGLTPFPGFVGTSPSGPLTFFQFGSGDLEGTASGDPGGAPENTGFHYTYKKSKGDLHVIARVGSLVGPNTKSAAGLMVRESLDTDARYFSVSMKMDGFIKVSRRNAIGGATTTTQLRFGFGQFEPVWLGILRLGNSFGAFYSRDGVFWSPIDTEQTVEMPSAAYMGLTTSSRGKGPVATALFDNVVAESSPPPANLFLPAPTLDVFLEPAPNAMGLSWHNVPGNLGYVIERSPDNVEWEPRSYVPPNATSFVDTQLAGGEFFCYRVATLDGIESPTSPPSSAFCGTTKPGAVQKPRAISYNCCLERSSSQYYPVVTLDWLEATGELGYRISRATSASGPWEVVWKDLPANASMFTDATHPTAPLQPDRVYWYKIETLDVSRRVTASRVLSVRTVPKSKAPAATTRIRGRSAP